MRRMISSKGSPWRALLHDESGQNIVLGALVLLFATMSVMVTFAVGNRVKEKIKLQALADSGAYSISVTEARLFNYFAWANRTHAAHDVAILSIHAHASYISYMESLYKGSKDSLDFIEGVGGVIWCAACFWSGQCCTECTNAYKFGKAGEKYWKDNDAESEGWALHQEWHEGDIYDKQMMGFARQHYSAIEALSAEQAALQRILEVGQQPRLLKDMPERAAQIVDPKIHSGQNAANASAKTLDEAVAWSGEEDWQEIVSATRDSGWVYKRNFISGGKWMSAVGKAERELQGQCWHIPSPSDDGNAKTTKPSTSFNALQNAIHQHLDNNDGWGGGDPPTKAYGAEDHGGIFTLGGCTECAWFGPGDANGGVISGPQRDSIGYHFYFHAGDEKKKAEPDIHDIGNCDNNDPPGCGIHIRHPRYRYGDDTQDIINADTRVWGYPHPEVVLTKANTRVGDPGRYPFDFHFTNLLFVRNPQIDFKTIETEGEKQSGDTMAAIAGGLVYYHKPGDWKEPPSFWNPYWRAKLHPLKGGGSTACQQADDKRQCVLSGDHSQSSYLGNAFIRY